MVRIGDFDEEVVTAALSGLARAHRVAFSACCAERLYPNYRLFSTETGWGEPEYLRQALDQVWTWLPVVPTDLRLLRGMMEHILTIGPDTDDFQSRYVGAAINASGSIYYTFQCCVTGAPSTAALAARVAVEAVADYFDAAGSLGFGLPPELFDRQVRLGAEAVDREVSRQWGDLELLRSRPTLTRESVCELRASSVASPITPPE